MPTKNVNLTEHYSQFVDELVESGKHKNASEVLRAGLRMLEQKTSEEQEKLALLRHLAAEGFEALDQGQGIDLPTRQRLSAHVARLGRQATKLAHKNGWMARFTDCAGQARDYLSKASATPARLFRVGRPLPMALSREGGGRCRLQERLSWAPRSAVDDLASTTEAVS